MDEQTTMAEGVTEAQQVVLKTGDIPTDQAICFRFTATNARGKDIQDGGCTPEMPSMPIRSAPTSTR